MSQQKLNLAIQGLYTSPNNLSGIPAGALAVANNVVIEAKNLIKSRRGQTQYGNPLSVGTGQVDKLFNYASALLASFDNKLAYDSGSGAWVAYSGTYAPPDAGYKVRSLEAQRNFYFTTSQGIYKLDSLSSTPRVAGAPNALGGTAALVGTTGFLVADSAVAYRLVWGYIDANNNLIVGAPSQRLVVSNSSGVDVDVALTYAVPSEITTEYFYQVYRSTGTATAGDEPADELQLVLQGNLSSSEIAARSFVRTDITPYSLMRETLYTSPSQQGIANANVQPPLALDMDLFKNCAFYANTKRRQTLSLALISVDSPSLGYVVDAGVDTVSASAVLTSITSTANLRVGMRAVGSGIPLNTVVTSVDSATQVTLSAAATATATVSVEFQDRFSAAGVDYWAASAANVATNAFLAETSLSPAQNITESTLSLINVINTTTSNTAIYGYYISGIEDLPGQFYLEERAIGGAAFTVSTTATSSFSPNLTDYSYVSAISAANPTVVTSTAHGLTSGQTITVSGSDSTPNIDGSRVVTVIDANSFSVPVNVTIPGITGKYLVDSTTVKSDNEVKPNRVYISKEGQIESVPTYRYYDIGSSNFPIQRVVALRDGIFFFKQDGVFRISGETFESFSVTLLDNTVVLKVPESAVAFNNQVFCFTTQGVCAITDSGVRIMSVPIEDQLLELASEQYTYFASASFGVAYESARQYMFCTVSFETDEFATQAFVYNALTESWTRFIMNRTCGIVSPAVDKLFMAQTDTGQVLVERKTFTTDDFADEQYVVDVVSVDSTSQLTLTDASALVEGMTVVQATRTALITDVNGNIIEITPTIGFEIGAATAYRPIENFLQWSPIDVENPGILKQFSEATYFFKDAAFTEIEAGFASNISNGRATVSLEATGSASWGSYDWGLEAWGGSPGGVNVLRTYVPRDKQRAHWLTMSLKTKQAFTGFALQGVSLIFKPMSSRFR